mmetsp:Transcript_159267/g.281188  ORF Transcript_159267/g.281188 Transcript_159267/m.281188 type:complete len:218 (-) Transcript_159267:103-756(-)
MLHSASMLRVILATSLVAVVAATCPPEGFDSIENFNLTAFVSKKWYIQQQAVTKYLPISENFCVAAEYEVLAKKTFWGYDIKVHNVAYERDGTLHDSGDTLYAKIVDAKTGKLEVGPYFVPTRFGGPYWVIAYDETEGYAVISGGPPTVEGEDGKCRTGSSSVNDAGLWIFTRQQTRDEALVNLARSIAESKGFDLTALNDVDQSTCPPKLDFPIVF